MRVIPAVLVALLGAVLNAVRAEKIVRAAYGEAVPDELLPQFVELRLINGRGDYHCGGTILEAGWVITAAHCIVDYGEPVEGIAFVLHLDNEEQQYIVPGGMTNIYIPSEYGPEIQPFEEQYYGDIALINVPAFENLEIRYPRLPNSREEVNNEPLLVAAGVGLDETQSVSDRLEFVSVNMVSGVGETPSFTPWPIESDHFVTKDSRGENQDTCGGDSGGGIFIPSRAWHSFTRDPELDEHSQETTNERDVLVGITSYGDGQFGCGQNGTFGVYTDVYYWKDWIQQTIANHTLTPSP